MKHGDDLPWAASFQLFRCPGCDKFHIIANGENAEVMSIISFDDAQARILIAELQGVMYETAAMK